MKKFFTLFAVALVAFAACDKNKTNDSTDDPNKEPEETEAIVTIDGTFDDWAKLTDVVVAEQSAEGNKGVKVMKLTSDEEYLYVYAEVAAELVSKQYVESDPWGVDGPTPFRLIIDLDNSDKTGGSDPHWMDEVAGYDALLDTFIYVDGTSVKLAFSQWWDFKADATVGEPLISNIQQISGDDDNHIVSELAGKLESGYVKVEYSVAVDMLKGLDGKTIVVGGYMYPVNWGTEVALPHAVTVTLK